MRIRAVKGTRQVDLYIPEDNRSLEDLIAIVGGSYGDLFASTRQKIAAWRLYQKYRKEVEHCDTAKYGESNESCYLDAVIYFFFNSSISPDFIRFCAKEEGDEDPYEYFLGLVEA